MPQDWMGELWEAIRSQGPTAMVLFFIVLVLLKMLHTERRRGHQAWQQLMQQMVLQTAVNTKQTMLLELLTGRKVDGE